MTDVMDNPQIDRDMTDIKANVYNLRILNWLMQRQVSGGS